MNEKKFDWDDLRLFLAIARRGGLSAAAASCGKSPPTLGRRMVALERRLARDLFRREARGYVLTPDGENLLRIAQSLEHGIEPLLREAQDTIPNVKISAGTWVSYHLCTQMRDIVQSDPIRLRFIAADERIDIAHREAVIGIRNQRPDGIGLAGSKIGRVQFAVFAGTDVKAPWAKVIGTTPSAHWVQANTKPHDCIEVTSPRNALDLALAGQARAVLPVFIGDRFEQLTRVSPPIDDLDHDQWLVTHHEDRYLPAVRKVIDRLRRILRSTCVQG